MTQMKIEQLQKEIAELEKIKRNSYIWSNKASYYINVLVTEIEHLHTALLKIANHDEHLHYESSYQEYLNLRNIARDAIENSLEIKPFEQEGETEW